MTNHESDFIPGYAVSTAEGLTSGAMAYAIVTTGNTVQNWFGYKVINLTGIGTGIYSGGVTVLHTLIMDDLEKLRNFIKNHTPWPLKNRVTNFVIDAAASTSILACFAGSAYGLSCLTGSPLSFDDAMHLSCITQLSNLATNHGIPGLYSLFTKAVKSQLGIKQN